jgi:hypothetical protein
MIKARRFIEFLVPYFIPGLGHIKLGSLTAADIQALYTAAKKIRRAKDDSEILRRLLVIGADGIPADFDALIDCDDCGQRHPGNDQHCPNCQQPASTGFHAIEPAERLKDCPVWIPGHGWLLATAPDDGDHE